MLKLLYKNYIYTKKIDDKNLIMEAKSVLHQLIFIYEPNDEMMKYFNEKSAFCHLHYSGII